MQVKKSVSFEPHPASLIIVAYEFLKHLERRRRRRRRAIKKTKPLINKSRTAITGTIQILYIYR